MADQNALSLTACFNKCQVPGRLNTKTRPNTGEPGAGGFRQIDEVIDSPDSHAIARDCKR